SSEGKSAGSAASPRGISAGAAEGTAGASVAVEPGRWTSTGAAVGRGAGAGAGAGSSKPGGSSDSGAAITSEEHRTKAAAPSISRGFTKIPPAIQRAG